MGKVDERNRWNGECYANFSSDSQSRVWEDAVRYGFLSGGGSRWHNGTLRSLEVGERVWVNVAPYGYVGVGIVLDLAQPAREFTVELPDGTKIPVLAASLKGNYRKQYLNDLDRCEYFVRVRWLQTVPVERAIRHEGFFGNQNTVCRPKTGRWRFTIEQLKKSFPQYAD